MSETKICEICNITKPLSEMYSRKLNGVIRYSIGCQDCYNIKVRKKRELKKLIKAGVLNPEENIPDNKQYCHKCKTFRTLDNFRMTKIRGKFRRDTKCNKCVGKNDKVKYRKLLKKWETDPADRTKHYKMQRASMNRRMERDPIFHITVRYRGRFKSCMQSGREWRSHLECSIDYLKRWFEYQFRILKIFSGIELSWNNRNTWHVDHVIPCKVFDFTNDEQVKICFNWSNLSPIPAHDNNSKSDKIIPQLIRRQIFLASIYKNITGNNDKTVEITNICDSAGVLNTAANGKLLVQQME